MPLKVKILNWQVQDEQKEFGTHHFAYQIKVVFKDEAEWTVVRKLKDFQALHQRLTAMFKCVQFPRSGSQFDAKNQNKNIKDLTQNTPDLADMIKKV